MKKTVLLTLMGLVLGLSGCKQIAGALYFIGWPGPSEEIEADFADLGKHSVAIVIYANETIQLNYATVRMTLPTRLAHFLDDNRDKKELKGITIMEPHKVVQFQDETIDWDTLDRTEIGKRLGVDYVLFISLTEYNMMEYGSSDLLRGRIGAQIKLYQSDGAGDGLVWECKEKDARVIYPKSGAAIQASASDVKKIRNHTEQLFSDKLIKKFYTHEVLSREE